MSHEYWMQRALTLAEQGRGRVNPNPMVGAVIVQNGNIIGEGYHSSYGSAHAERAALEACTQDPRGATMYVTLEPCCHHGKTPPCTESILASGIQTVVIGSHDPNPKVSGGGTLALKQGGLTVLPDVLRSECDKLNQIFFHYIQSRTPYTTLKYAMTADGKIATHTGASRWITGEVARTHVHEMRNTHAAIMIGSGTALADNPLLTCRTPNGQNPVRIVCDSKLSTPLDHNLITTAKNVPTILATANRSAADQAPYLDAGCQILDLPALDGRVDLSKLMQTLHTAQIDSVLVEGGAELNFSLLQAGLVQNLKLYLAPKLFGGSTAKGPIGGHGVSLPDAAYKLSPPAITHLGEDLLLEYDVQGGNS